MTRLELARLSLVRFGASLLILLTTAVLNRVLIVEVGLAAGLVTVVLAFQHLTSPLALVSGRLSDRVPLGGRRRVPWIRLWTLIAGLTVPVLPWVAYRMGSGVVALVSSAVLFGLFGFGLKAANLLVSALIVDRVADPAERGRCLNVVWIVAIAGFIVGGLLVRALLPDESVSSEQSLAAVTRACVLMALLAVGLCWLGTIGLEAPAPPREPTPLRALVVERTLGSGGRALLAFLFLADFSFFLQEFVLEAFGGEVLGLSAAQTTGFNVTFGLGLLLAMTSAGVAGTLFPTFATRRVLAISCFSGAAGFLLLVASALWRSAPMLTPVVLLLGISKGLYNVGLSFSFTALSTPADAGAVMGLWGAVGGFAVALGSLGGGLVKSVAEDVVRSTPAAYAAVFALEAFGLLACLPLLRRARL